ncbi:hypothetical protein AB0F15_00365 [Amycolatopsis sp. NPDC026612]|uniref:hypothetical protein n=1 Tax=Amycolatopsis sp. NPDC026612 TaxID=3155466 RepID=UPI0033D2AA7E
MRGKIVFDARLRTTSSAESLPWLAGTVTLLRIGADGLVTQAKTDAAKRAMLGAAEESDLLIVAWPGEWSQDLVVVDDLPAARLAVGLPRRRVVPAVTANEHPEPSLGTGWSSAESQGLWGAWPRCRVCRKKESSNSSTKPLSGYPRGGSSRCSLERTSTTRRGRDCWPVWSRGTPRISSLPTAALPRQALELLNRFPAKASVLGAALQRPEISQTAMREVATLSYDDAAKLWWDAKNWPAQTKTQLAATILDVVLGSQPPEPPSEVPGRRDRHTSEMLLRDLIAEQPSDRREELLSHPELGSRIRRAFLAADELTDTELLQCLPELKTAEATDVLACLKRFPRLTQLARDEVGDVIADMIAGGWDPVRIAHTGEWADLVAVAKATTTSACVDALVTTAVDARPRQQVSYYQLVDAIVANPAASTAQLRRLLEHLPDDHLHDIEEPLPARSRTRRLCAEVLTARQSRTVPAAKPAPATENLPTDEELSAMADPWRRLPTCSAIGAESGTQSSLTPSAPPI